MRRSRTGAIHLPAGLIDRVMTALVSAGRPTSRGLVFDFGPKSVLGPRAVAMKTIGLGRFRVPNHATGKITNVSVVLGQGDRAEGRMSIMPTKERKLSKEEMRDRVRTALRRLGATVPPEKLDKLANDTIFDWHYGIEVGIDIPDRPLTTSDLLRLRAVVRHELTHVADETTRRYQSREAAKSDVLTDIDLIAETLGLGEYRPKKHERMTPLSHEGDAWANDPKEVTAMIPEIMEEVGPFQKNMMSFRVRRVLEGRPDFPSRERELIAFFRWISPTYREISSSWTPKNLNRVLRALWDRYHEEPGFPAAEGLYRNRRTSRRRTSRRVA